MVTSGADALAVMEDYAALKVCELKDILTRKGITTAGKKKTELLELVRRAQGVYKDLERCDKEESERKRRCVDGIDLSGKVVSWSKELNKMPAIKEGNVFAYLLHHCKWSRERLDCFESDDGYKMHSDRHMEDMQIGKHLFFQSCHFQVIPAIIRKNLFNNN